jgi:hypothetical protein
MRESVCDGEQYRLFVSFVYKRLRNTAGAVAISDGIGASARGFASSPGNISVA